MSKYEEAMAFIHHIAGDEETVELFQGIIREAEKVDVLMAAVKHHRQHCEEMCHACGGLGPHFDIASCAAWARVV